MRAANFIAAAILTFVLGQSGFAVAQTTAALTGVVTSAEEGPMEGVLVSAKKGTIATTVVTDRDGRFSSPAGRLEPGQYALQIRAAGYELDGARAIDVAADKSVTVDLKLRKTRKLAAQLTNAEWIISVPGNAAQKNTLLNCVGCHTLERVVKSQHDAAGLPPGLK